ncbi:hypothetical protein [Mycolicibacterium iranicum]|uniref:hypothetical protein n=1 Tax=Mycolicibacterium iranicum TaxID=912594 RepID=UPI0013A575EF|nr:hypothetical protein [Mycolicibacterium iranicum]
MGAVSVRSASAVNPSTESIASRVRSSESGHRWLYVTAAIIAAGLDAVQHWNDAQHAIKAWDAAASGLTAFAAAARVNTEQRYLVFTDSDAATVQPALTTARQAGASHVDAWTLARHGTPLDLATLKTFTARVARHQAEDQDVDVAYQ